MSAANITLDSVSLYDLLKSIHDKIIDGQAMNMFIDDHVTIWQNNDRDKWYAIFRLSS